MLSDLASELNTAMEKAEYYLYPWLITFAVLWGINVFNWIILKGKLNRYGIYPRSLRGIVGIFFSPILHQNFSHLFFNSIPLFALGLTLLTRGLDQFIQVSIVVIIVGGLLVWLFGRKANHIGASGLVSGYFGYILATAYFNPSFTTLLCALVVAYYFGGIFLGLFPSEEEISWESHLFGFLAGILSAFIPFTIWSMVGWNFGKKL